MRGQKRPPTKSGKPLDNKKFFLSFQNLLQIPVWRKNACERQKRAGKSHAKESLRWSLSFFLTWDPFCNSSLQHPLLTPERKKKNLQGSARHEIQDHVAVASYEKKPLFSGLLILLRKGIRLQSCTILELSVTETEREAVAMREFSWHFPSELSGWIILT